MITYFASDDIDLKELLVFKLMIFLFVVKLKCVIFPFSEYRVETHGY